MSAKYVRLKKYFLITPRNNGKKFDKQTKKCLLNRRAKNPQITQNFVHAIAKINTLQILVYVNMQLQTPTCTFLLKYSLDNDRKEIN